jgi:hypothetical protein
VHLTVRLDGAPGFAGWDAIANVTVQTSRCRLHDADLAVPSTPGLDAPGAPHADSPRTPPERGGASSPHPQKIGALRKSLGARRNSARRGAARAAPAGREKGRGAAGRARASGGVGTAREGVWWRGAARASARARQFTKAGCGRGAPCRPLSRRVQGRPAAACCCCCSPVDLPNRPPRMPSIGPGAAPQTSEGFRFGAIGSWYTRPLSKGASNDGVGWGKRPGNSGRKGSKEGGTTEEVRARQAATEHGRKGGRRPRAPRGEPACSA